MDRRRRIERPGKPNVQRKLRRLAHAADEQQQRDGGRTAHFPSRQRREDNRRVSCLGEQCLEFQRAVERMGQDDTGEKCHVAEAQKRKRSKGAFQRRRMRMIVSQHIKQVAQELPEDEQHHEIAA